MPDFGVAKVENWRLDTKIASQMSRWQEFRGPRRSWLVGPGPFVVEVETSDGHIGVGHSSGGELGAYIVERHLAAMAEGSVLSRDDIRDVWERMFHGTIHIGRRGIALHAISAVDNALWDAWGRSRGEPVWSLIGPRHHDSLPCYATTPRPEMAKDAGFVGAKLALPAGFAEGVAGHAENLALAEQMRSRCGAGDDFWLAYDCYMSLDVQSAVALAGPLRELGFRWIEECLPPDDYWGYAELRRRVGDTIAVATGEHEDTRWGFDLLMDYGCADVLQPDLNWCGGLSEVNAIAERARARGIRVMPHAPGTVGYHYLVTCSDAEAAEVVVDVPEDPEGPPVPALFCGELVPRRGRVTPTDDPGFGLSINPQISLRRPFPH